MSMVGEDPKHEQIPRRDDKESEEVVGHKTFSTGDPLHPFRHEPLTRSEADALWERAEHLQRQRAVDMPTEEAAVATMFNAWLRLKELGWKETRYGPATIQDAKIIELGSSGIHTGSRSEGGCFWIAEAGDLWPSHPCLYRSDK